MELTLSRLLSYFDDWVTVLQRFWVLLNTNVETLVSDKIASGSLYLAPVYPLLELTGVNDFTLLGLIIGYGLIIYIVYQFIIWIFNLIT